MSKVSEAARVSNVHMMMCMILDIPEDRNIHDYFSKYGGDYQKSFDYILKTYYGDPDDIPNDGWIKPEELLPSDCCNDCCLVVIQERGGFWWKIPKVAEYRKNLNDWRIEAGDQTFWLKDLVNKNGEQDFFVRYWMTLPRLPVEVYNYE